MTAVCNSASITGRSPLTRGRLHRSGVTAAGGGSIPAHAGQTSINLRMSCPPWVDPRSRGADVSPSMYPCRMAGRSPLTRGRHKGTDYACVGTRSIPAHAGQTCGPAGIVFTARVDPRSRGADSGGPSPGSGRSGRSPLTRGRLLCPDRLPPGHGSIPAHAGQTTDHWGKRGMMGVDPRSRGADATTTRAATPWAGRSPLTRGRRTPRPTRARRRGSIPAHAGQTS